MSATGFLEGFQNAFRRYKARKLRHAFAGFQQYDQDALQSYGKPRTYAVMTTHAVHETSGRVIEPGSIHLVGPSYDQYLLPAAYFYSNFVISSTYGATPVSETVDAIRVTGEVLRALAQHAEKYPSIAATLVGMPNEGDFIIRKGKLFVVSEAKIFDAKYSVVLHEEDLPQAEA